MPSSGLWKMQKRSHPAVAPVEVEKAWFRIAASESSVDRSERMASARTAGTRAVRLFCGLWLLTTERHRRIHTQRAPGGDRPRG